MDAGKRTPLTGYILITYEHMNIDFVRNWYHYMNRSDTSRILVNKKIEVSITGDDVYDPKYIESPWLFNFNSVNSMELQKHGVFVIKNTSNYKGEWYGFTCGSESKSN